MLDPEVIINRMLAGGAVKYRIPAELILELINQVEPYFRREPTLLRLRPPLNVVGDLHGQYSDMLRVFQVSLYSPLTSVTEV